MGFPGHGELSVALPENGFADGRNTNWYCFSYVCFIETFTAYLASEMRWRIRQAEEIGVLCAASCIKLDFSANNYEKLQNDRKKLHIHLVRQNVNKI